MRAHIVHIGLITLLATGCGLSEDKVVTDLTEGQLERMCKDLIKVEPVSLTCDDTFTVYSPPTLEECVRDFEDLPSGCIATVGDVYACTDGWADVSCDSQIPAACAVYGDASCQPEAPPEESDGE